MLAVVTVLIVSGKFRRVLCQRRGNESFLARAPARDLCHRTVRRYKYSSSSLKLFCGPG